MFEKTPEATGKSVNLDAAHRVIAAAREKATSLKLDFDLWRVLTNPAEQGAPGFG